MGRRETRGDLFINLTRCETLFSYSTRYDFIFLLLLQLNSQSIIWNRMKILKIEKLQPCFGDSGMQICERIRAKLICPLCNKCKIIPRQCAVCKYCK